MLNAFGEVSELSLALQSEYTQQSLGLHACETLHQSFSAVQ